MTDYTYSTGNPIGSTDVRDGVDNLKSFDVLLNSTDDAYQDRLGNTVPTAAGAIKALGPVVTTWTFTTGGTLTYPNEAALNPVDGNYYGWTGDFPKVVAPGTDPTLPGSGYVPRTDVVLRDQLPYVIYSATGIADAAGVFAAAAAATAANKMLAIHGIANIESAITIDAPIFDTKQQIFTPTSAVTITSGYTRPEWFGDHEGSIDKAIRALPNPEGGIVKLESRAYKRNGYLYNSGNYMDRPNIKIIGSKMPCLSFDAKSLTDGSVIQGPFLVFADNFQCEDVGFDSGKNYIDTYHGGVGGSIIGEGLILTYPTDAIKTASPTKRTAKLKNVIGLCESPTSLTHAVIVGEGYVDVSCEGDVVGVYGVHGVVVKCAGVTAETFKAYANSSEGVIIKSDAQASAKANNIDIGKVITSTSLPIGVSASAVTAAGIAGAGVQLMSVGANPIDKVNIGLLDSSGAKRPIEYLFGGAADMRSIHIGKAIVDCYGAASSPSGVFCDQRTSGGKLLNCGITDLEVRNAQVGVQVFNNAHSDKSNFTIGKLSAINCSSATDIGLETRLTIDVVNTENCTGGVFNLSGNVSPRIGVINKDSATGAIITGTLVPALSSGWDTYQGGTPFSVIPSGYGVTLIGLIKPTGSSQTVATLPSWARPASNKRFIVNGSNGSVISAVSVTVDTSGFITVNEIGGGVANCSAWLSLDGIKYQFNA